MVDKSLVTTFLNEEGSSASITLSGIINDITQGEVSAAMDVVIAKNIFQSSSGNLVTKNSAQITEGNVTNLVVK